MHWLVNGVANGSLFVLRRVAVLWVAVGRAPAPCTSWLMYTHGLTALPVGLGSGSAGRAAAPAAFVGSGIRGGLGMAGALLWGRVARCLPAPVVSVLCWRVYLSGGGFRGRVGLFRRPLWMGVVPWGVRWTPSRGLCGFVDLAVSPCVVGWCGVVPRL